jgi:hypothetical protein
LVPVMKKRAVLALLLFLLGSLSIFTSGAVFALSGNWVEVAKLTGGGGIGTTDHFTCDHADWRIRWEIEPTNSSERTAFLVYIFPYSDAFRREAWFESIQHYGTEETSGILYIYNHSGSFDMDVLASIESYTMIIEQDVESILEFPSWTIVPIFTIATLLIIICKHKLPKTSKPKIILGD